ncbi:hypothetical protein N9S11_00090 [Candidatus Pelagibacter sp.]|jgi:hypothetical protein|nr:hypothetical protein [Candidatus Pelagibacter sp.]|tara:strand:- start:76 stop:654 length:579 start_codon:yes stop_codon:yes gene_type:complete
MNIALVHPYISYLLIFIIVTSLSTWLVDFIKKKNELITLISFFGYILSIISLSIFNSIFIIFIYSVGFFVNEDLFLGILWICIYVYCANGILKIFNEEFRDNKKYKLFVKIIIVGPFIVSFIIFYVLFYGDKIYKLSPHCENTNDPKIKVCKYSNGTYTGEMKAFKRHGQGEYIWDSGKTFKGKWIEGKVVE